MRLAVGCVVLGMASGCFYAQDPLAADLKQGDVRGVTVGVPPGTSALEKLRGARARLRGSSVVRTTGVDGVFTLRNLPEGNHTVDLTWQTAPRGDDAVLVARSSTPIRVHPVSGGRSALDLGDVRLLEPGNISGSVDASAVTPAVDPASIVVAVLNTDVRVQLDGNNRFNVGGLGAGTWQLVAAAPGAMSAVVGATVTSGAGTMLSQPLLLMAATQTGTVDGRLVEEPTVTPLSGASAPLRAAVTLDLFPVAGAVDPPAANVEPEFALLAPVGLYTGVFSSPGTYQSILVHNILVQADTAMTLGDLLLRVTPSGACVDLDGDGACFSATWSDPCRTTCRTAMEANPSCQDGNVRVDCDDDADGQLDVDELLGPAMPGPGQLPGACACGSVAGTQNGPPCANDSARSDRDFDGVCDAFDLEPDCPAGQACSRVPGVDGGPGDAGDPVDSGAVDAGADDAGVDAGGFDAGVDAGPAPPPFTVLAGGPRPMRMREFPDGRLAILWVQVGGVSPLGPLCSPSEPTQGFDYAVALHDAQGACLMAWTVRPGAVFESAARGLEVDPQGRLLVVGQHQNEILVAPGGGMFAPLAQDMGAYAHALRFDPATPTALPNMFVMVHGQVALNGIRHEPASNTTVVMGNGTPDLDLNIGGESYPSMGQYSGFALKLDTAWTLNQMRHFRVSGGNAAMLGSTLDVSGDVGLVGFASDGVTVNGPVQTPVDFILTSATAGQVFFWRQPSGGGNAVQQVLPITVTGGTEIPVALLDARQTGSQTLLALRMESTSQAQVNLGLPQGRTARSFGPSSVAMLEFNSALLFGSRVLSLGTQVRNQSNVEDASFDAAGELLVVGTAEQGLLVTTHTGQGVRLATANNGGFVARLSFDGHSAAFINDSTGSGAGFASALLPATSGNTRVGGVLNGTSFTLGDQPACAAAASNLMPTLSGNPTSFLWTVDPRLLTTSCLLEGSQVADPESGDPDAPTFPGLGYTGALEGFGDVDCFSIVPPRTGNLEVFVGGTCEVPLEIGWYTGAPSTLQYILPPLMPGNCHTETRFVAVGDNTVLCVSNAGGGPATGVVLTLSQNFPPNDACAAAEARNLGTVGAGSASFFSGSTFSAIQEPDHIAACGALDLPDVYFSVTGGGAPMEARILTVHGAQGAQAISVSTVADCTALMETCTAFLTPITVNLPAQLRVSGFSRVVDQGDFRVLLRDPSPPPTRMGFNSCATGGPGVDVALAVTPNGSLANDTFSTADDLNGSVLYLPTGQTCAPMGAEEVFYGFAVPDGIRLRVGVVGDRAMNIYIVDDCALPTPNCLGRSLSNTSGDFNVAEWANTTGAIQTVHVAVEAAVSPSGPAPFSVYWETF